LCQRVNPDRERLEWRIYQIDEIPVETVAPDTRLPDATVRELAERYFADKLMRPWEELRAAGFEVSVHDETAD
jgi:hypothetical protein